MLIDNFCYIQFDARLAFQCIWTPLMCRLEVLFLRKTSAFATPAQLKLEMAVAFDVPVKRDKGFFSSKIPKRKGYDGVGITWHYWSPFLKPKPKPKGDKLLPQSCRNNWQYDQDKPDQLQGNMSLYQLKISGQSVCPCPIIGLQYQHLIYPFFSPRISFIIILLIPSLLLALAQTAVSIHSFIPKHFLPIKARADNPDEETKKIGAKKSNQNTIYRHYVTHQ